jgi:hypothetical protein
MFNNTIQLTRKACRGFVDVTLIHHVRNLVTVILGNIEMGNLTQALEAAERLEANIRLCTILKNVTYVKN